MRLLLRRLHMERADVRHIASLFRSEVGNRNTGYSEEKNDCADEQ